MLVEDVLKLLLLDLKPIIQYPNQVEERLNSRLIIDAERRILVNVEPILRRWKELYIQDGLDP